MQKFYGMLSELTDLEVDGFPTKFPMFLLGTQEELDDYSKLMFKAISLGFDPKIRKLCFTLGCKEGYTHEDIFNLIKSIPEIDKEKYVLLKNIPHWNPVAEAIKVINNYITLVEVAQSSPSTEKILGFLKEASEDAEDSRDPKIFKSKK